MITVTIVLGVLSLAAARGGPYLLVIDQSEPSQCREAPAGWHDNQDIKTATSTSVDADLRRYFAGMSVQLTAVLDAAWHGGIRFCTAAEERSVLGTLVELVIRPAESNNPVTLDPVGLPSGADQLLVGFSSQALLDQVYSFRPATEAERSRQRTAARVVFTSLQARPQ